MPAQSEAIVVRLPKPIVFDVLTRLDADGTSRLRSNGVTRYPVSIHFLLSASKTRVFLPSCSRTGSHGKGMSATAAHLAEQAPNAVLHAIIAGGATGAAIVPNTTPAAL
jgi:hypothetical protein